MTYSLPQLCLAAFMDVTVPVNWFLRPKQTLIGERSLSDPLSTSLPVMLVIDSHTINLIPFIAAQTFFSPLRKLLTPSPSLKLLCMYEIPYTERAKPYSYVKMALILLKLGLMPSFSHSSTDRLVAIPQELVELLIMQLLAFPNLSSWRWVAGPPRQGSFIFVITPVFAPPSSLQLSGSTINSMPQLLALIFSPPPPLLSPYQPFYSHALASAIYLVVGGCVSPALAYLLLHVTLWLQRLAFKRGIVQHSGLS